MATGSEGRAHVVDDNQWLLNSGGYALPQSGVRFALDELQPLYQLATTLTALGAPGEVAVMRSHTAAEVYFESEYYVFKADEASRRLGELDRGGKGAKAARRQAIVAFQARVYLDQSAEKSQSWQGEVKMYDPFAFSQRKLSLPDAVNLGHELRTSALDQWAEHQEQGTNIDRYAHMSRSWYLAHLLKDHYLPWETITLLAVLVKSVKQAAEILSDLRPEDDLGSMSLNRLLSLYPE